MPWIRFSIAAALFWVVFGNVAAADLISFSGSIDANETFHLLELNGTDGLSLFSDLPSGVSEAPRSTCTSPCEVSLGFGVADLDEPGAWSTSFEGTTILSAVGNQAGSIGGFLQFTSPPFVPSDCVGCSMSLPMTFYGEIKATFADGSHLYDLAVSGSGSIQFNTAPFGGGVFEFFDLQGDIAGTATPLPEPGTAVFMLCGFAMLKRCLGAAKRM